LGKSQDQVLLALIATLDDDARKRGRKSVIKRVVSRLVAAGADDATIATITALRTQTSDKSEPKTSTEPKTLPKAGSKTDAGTGNGNSAAPRAKDASVKTSAAGPGKLAPSGDQAKAG
jgi:hypothetical protein